MKTLEPIDNTLKIHLEIVQESRSEIEKGNVQTWEDFIDGFSKEKGEIES